jgi:uncharacterized protein YbjT (DUF2867 family)
MMPITSVQVAIPPSYRYEAAVTTAVMIGATGLVGSHVLGRLLAEPRFSRVLTFGRRKKGAQHAKLEEHAIDFEQPAAWASLVTGGVVFSCLGTTAGQAGNQAAQRKVEYDYQLDFAKAAVKNGAKTYVLCSAASADPGSRTFYSRVKGELDRDVQQLGFTQVRIMRPSLLGGEREKARTGEEIGSAMLGALNAIGIARRYREIPGDVVAQAMVNAAFDPEPGTKIFTLDEVFAEAQRAPQPAHTTP